MKKFISDVSLLDLIPFNFKGNEETENILKTIDFMLRERFIKKIPEVILMDEPTSALDPISTSKIEDLAMELKKDYTIVMVTHNMQQAVRVSDNTAFFLLGEVIEYNETEKLFSIPADKRTEDYITGRFG